MSLFEAAQLLLIFGLLVFKAQPTVMYTIFSFLTGLIGSLLLLRAWCWTLAITPRDPVVGFIWKATNWLVTPFGFVVRPRGNWDLPTLAATVFVALVQVWAGRELMGMPETATAFIVAIIAMTLRWLVNLLIWGTIIYCVLSFFANRWSGYMALLGTLLDPFLRPFRRLLPPIKGFDLSPILFFLLLNLALRFLVPASMGLYVF